MATPHATTIRPTRFPELGYRNDGRGLWRIYALDTVRPVNRTMRARPSCSAI